MNFNRILFIGDDPFLREGASSILKSAGFYVDFAIDRQSGVKQSVDRPPHLIMCNLSRSKSEVLKLMEQLSDNPLTEDIPLFVIPPHVIRQLIREHFNSGHQNHPAGRGRPSVKGSISPLANEGQSLQERPVYGDGGGQSFSQEVPSRLPPTASVLLSLVGITPTAQIQAAQTNLAESKCDSHRKQIIVRSGTTREIINMEKVIALTSDGEYSIGHLVGEKKLMWRKSLVKWASELDSREFFQVHRSSIINLKYLSKVNNLADGRVEVQMRNLNLKLFVSNRFRSRFNRCLKFLSKPLDQAYS